jgi:hypothetical protein
MSIVDSKYNNELELVRLSILREWGMVPRWGASQILLFSLPWGWMHLVAEGLARASPGPYPGAFQLPRGGRCSFRFAPGVK